MEDKYLTIGDVAKIAEKPFNVVKFGDLKKYKNLDDLFHPKEMGMEYYPVNDVLLLYEMEPNSGHWCVLKRLPAKGYNCYFDYHFVDSYGEIIDSQRKHIDKNFRIKSGQNTPNILLKLYEAQKDMNARYPPMNIHYNDEKLQGEKSSTCGRYAGLFIRFNTTAENFAKQLKTLAKKKKISVDQLVIDLTANLLEPKTEIDQESDSE